MELKVTDVYGEQKENAKGKFISLKMLLTALTSGY